MSETEKLLKLENAALRARMEWMRLECRVIYYPPGEGLPYPIEHNLPANKDQWEELMHRAEFKLGSG